MSSWLNVNQSFNDIKGRITNFASEVLSDVPLQESGDNEEAEHSNLQKLQEKCHCQELEIAALKRLNEELEASLKAEKSSHKHSDDDQSEWNWNVPQFKPEQEHVFKSQIQVLQNELDNLKDRECALKGGEEEVNRLKEENRNLTANLEDLNNQHEAAMEKLLSLKQELQKNFEILKIEHEELKSSNDEYLAQIKTFESKLKDRDDDIDRYKSEKAEYDTLMHKYHNLDRIHGVLKENAEKFQEENQELHEENFKLQERITTLEHDLELANINSEANTVPKKEYDKIVKELKALQLHKVSETVHSDEVNIDDNAKSVIENLKRELKEARHKLHKNSASNDNYIKEETIKDLYDKYVKSDIFDDDTTKHHENEILNKLETAFKSLDKIKKANDNLQQTNLERTLNINHLQNQIDDLAAENDFLTTDIQQFEKELKEMKKNNDFLLTELAALKNTSKLQPIIESNEDNVVKLESELEDCTKINKNFEALITNKNAELEEAKKKKQLLESELSDLKERYNHILGELDSCKSHSLLLEQFQSSGNHYTEEQYRSIVDEIEALKTNFNLTNANNEKLNIDIQILENDKVLLLKEIDDLKHLLKHKRQDDENIESAKKTLDDELKVLKTQLNELQNDTAKHQVEHSDIKEHITRLYVMCKNNANVKDEHEVIEANGTLKEMVGKLEAELLSLLQSDSNSIKEKDDLKSSVSLLEKKLQTLTNTYGELNKTLESYKKINTEVEKLKSDNVKLVEDKAYLENQLISTDEKIFQLNETFNRLLLDIQEKDNIIDDLNKVIEKNKTHILELEQMTVDLETNVTIKNTEIERLNTLLNNYTEKHENEKLSKAKCEENLQQMAALKNETAKEDTEKQNTINELNTIIENNKIQINELEKIIIELKANVSNKETEIKHLISVQKNMTEQINNEALHKKSIEDNQKVITDLKTQINLLENQTEEYKTQLQHKTEEVFTLNQTITELNVKINSNETKLEPNEEIINLKQEYENLIKQLNLTNQSLVEKQQLIEGLKLQFEQAEIANQTIIQQIEKDKAELINLVNLKHNESIQYHNEIQRLNQVILEQTNEFKRILSQKDELLSQHNQTNKTCNTCENLKVTLKEKDEIIKLLNNGSNEIERMKMELNSANETVKNLTDKCENLDKNLALQLDAVMRLTVENAKLTEQEMSSARELERLRQHLVETEESYTAELMGCEQKFTQCQARLTQVEQRAQQSSTVYTSNSIRANQEVETLRNQIKLLERQREDVQLKLSEAEDAKNRSEAALTNLQVVLEQFTMDKERDVVASTEKIRNKMADLEKQNGALKGEISRLNQKLEESLHGLQAATRLGDQLETKAAIINDLKEQVKALQTTAAAAEERYYSAVTNQQDRVDKNLVKNLVLNFVLTQGQSLCNRTQMLRVLSSVLDFNQQECEKIGLIKAAANHDSLAQEFVKFLEKESRPAATLPNLMNIAQSSRSSTPSSRRNSGLGPQPNPYEYTHKRNTSTGSNNLLFQPIESGTTIDTVLQPNTTDMTTGRNNESAILKNALSNS